MREQEAIRGEHRLIFYGGQLATVKDAIVGELGFASLID